MNNFFSNKKGFSLFISLVIANSLLFVSFIISKIATRGLEFVNIGKDSQVAFFAADAGLECALYWDVFSGTGRFAGGATSINCMGVSITSGISPMNPGSTTLAKIGDVGVPAGRFYFSLNSVSNPTNACAIVYVYKNGATTHISSRGYNTCDPNNRRRIERGVEVTY